MSHPTSRWLLRRALHLHHRQRREPGLILQKMLYQRVPQFPRFFLRKLQRCIDFLHTGHISSSTPGFRVDVITSNS
jgi:hypothetical protein